MRVTNKTIFNGMVSNTQKNLERLKRAQEQIASGNRVLQPSDDPTAFSNIMEVYAQLNRNSQYARNINDGLAWLTQSEAAFNDATGVLQRVRELTVEGADAHLTIEDTRAIAKEVDTMLDQMVTVANANMGDKYIFAGLNNVYPPFKRDGNDPDIINFTGDNEELLREIAPGARFKVNSGAEEIFNERVNNVVTVDPSMLKEIKAENLQFGDYYIDTGVVSAASDSSAVVSQAYSQAGNTIIAGVSVDAGNTNNASILVEITDIEYDTDGNIIKVTANFKSHEYGAGSNEETAPPADVTHTFNVTGGDPDKEIVNVGGVDLTLDLTQFVRKGDKAVINVTAAVAVDDKQITVRNGDGNCLQWSFGPGVMDDKSATLNFYNIDTDNGGIYDGNISLEAGALENLDNAASFSFGNVFDAFIYLRKKLEAASFTKTGDMLKHIDQKIDIFLQERSKVGARVNHFEAAEAQYKNQELILSDVLKTLEGADIAKITIEFEEARVAYQGVLSSGARMIQLSLLDYLR